MKKEKLKGKEGFERYYRNMFGKRWENLKTALLEDVKYYELADGLKAPYFLDKASYWAACQLPKLSDGKCLDLCAAPGGKSLVLMTKVLADNTRLDANELSASRRGRLKRVLSESLPEDKLSRVDILAYDGSKMCKKIRNEYERILLDAPCSSERHVLTNIKYLDEWSEARIKNLSIRQWALLSSAFLLLKAEAYLLYCTCALSEIENDCVIDKALAKYPEAELIKIESFENAEETRNGLIFMPDTSSYGPLYFSLLRKKAPS